MKPSIERFKNKNHMALLRLLGVRGLWTVRIRPHGKEKAEFIAFEGSKAFCEELQGAYEKLGYMIH